ncbi:MAG: LTA synthase family protein [Muribaculaceae bacterium]|nr:LTA synthase family protein [Muribaculaceae bacterium]
MNNALSTIQQELRDKWWSKVITRRSAFFLIDGAVIVLMLLVVGISITHNMFGSLSQQPLCKMFFNSVADTLLLLSPCWIVKRKRAIALVITWLVALWSFVQILYFQTYQDVMPFASFLMVENISPTLIHSALGSITKKAIFVLLLPLLPHLYHLLWLRNDRKHKGQRRWWMFIISIIAFVVMRLVITTSIYLTNKQNYNDLHEAFVSRYCHLGGRHRNYIMHNGVMAYSIYNLISGIKVSVSKEELDMARTFLKKDCPHYNDNPHATTIVKPNLIFIMVESLNAWAVNLDIDGKPVTPTLNALAADTASNIVCLNVITQVKNGRSSDGKFMYQTGLLPLTNKVVAVEFSNRNFPSLVKAMKQKGCRAIEICGDEPSLWNIEHMSQAYGFDTLMHGPELKEQLMASDYMIDKVVMEKAASFLPSVNGNFIAQLFTGVMHSPYNDTWRAPTWISGSKQYTPAVRNYLEKTHYFDTQLGIFLQQLKQSGIYDKSVIVIASDHSELVDDAPNGRPSLSRNGNECVLIVINPAHGKLIDGPMGQIDVYPTVLDVMGLNSYYWKGLGHSALRNNPHSVSITLDETTGTSPLLHQQQQAWKVSDILIRADKFKF